MKLHQLSLFVENRPGQLAVPCRALAEAGINIITLSLADTQQFGILRLVVKDWQGAKKVLEDADCVVNVTEMVAIEVRDEPGGMAEVLEAVGKVDVNIEYMYAFTTRRGNRAVLLFRFDNPDAAITSLAGTNVNVVESIDIYEGTD